MLGEADDTFRYPSSSGDAPASLPIAVVKYSDKSHLREKGFVLVYSSRVASHNGDIKAAETAGHIMSTNKETEWDEHLLLLSALSAFYSPGFQPWNSPSLLSMSLSPSVNIIQALIGMLRCHLLGDSRCYQLTALAITASTHLVCGGSLWDFAG